MSLNVNKVIVAGRMAWKGNLKTIPSGATILNFTVAINEQGKDNKPTTEYASCIAWSKTAEFVNNYFNVGTPIYVEGRMKTTEYDKEGVKTKATNINVNEVKFVTDKQSNTSSAPQEDRPVQREEAPQIETAFEPELPF